MILLGNNKFKIMVMVAVIVLALASGGYWYYEYAWKRQIHWQPGPEVPFTASDLAKAQPLEPGSGGFADKKIIAVAFTGSMDVVYAIVTDPNMIRQVVEGLLRAERIKGGRLLKGFNLEMVFEDRTKTTFRFKFDSREKLIKGTTWDSKELYPLFKTIFKKYFSESFEP